MERADHLEEAASEIKSSITKEKITSIVSLIPEDWLQDDSSNLSPDEMRAAYIEFLCSKMSKIDLLVKEANDAK